MKKGERRATSHEGHWLQRTSKLEDDWTDVGSPQKKRPDRSPGFPDRVILNGCSRWDCRPAPQVLHHMGQGTCSIALRAFRRGRFRRLAHDLVVSHAT